MVLLTNKYYMFSIFKHNKKALYSAFLGCGESLLHSLFYSEPLLCVNTDKKKRRDFYDGCFKNHRDERVSVSVEELVPQDHFLRAIEATISFDFIEEKLRPYYCENNGRPSIHPIVLFKMMFIGYFTVFVLSVNWKRKLKRILPTVGFRVSLSDTIPDHSTISWNRRTRFIHTNIFEEILMRL